MKRYKINLDTLNSIMQFAAIAETINCDVLVTDSDRKFIANGKSPLGLAAAKEFDSMWLESEEDVYTKFIDFID